MNPPSSLRVKSHIQLLAIITITAVFSVFFFAYRLQTPGKLSRSGSATALKATAPATVHIRIQGQWKHVHQSLGLPPLRDEIVLPLKNVASPSPPPPSAALRTRFFRFNRRGIKDTTQTVAVAVLPELHFAEDALQERSLSYKELQETFRLDILKEKKEAEEELATHVNSRRRRASSNRGHRI
ncbi:hypothetical protein L218DRAFT_117666 [Marasmius fiardii PR-910]|nr:hypothetical protein L218DRAFT_117666 [Marasmius fiardii PR-910]